jgi:hypothetical protein
VPDLQTPPPGAIHGQTRTEDGERQENIYQEEVASAPSVEIHRQSLITSRCPVRRCGVPAICRRQQMSTDQENYYR